VLAYLRIISVSLLAMVAISYATIAPAMAGPGHFIDWGDCSCSLGDF
jgi:hypothetical protein